MHEADLAAVAVRCLLGELPAGGRHHLTGPEQLSQREQLAAIGAALGRALRFDELPPEDAVRELGAEFPRGLVEAIVAGQGAFVGTPEAMTHEVEELTGRPARTFARMGPRPRRGLPLSAAGWATGSEVGPAAMRGQGRRSVARMAWWSLPGRSSTRKLAASMPRVASTWSICGPMVRVRGWGPRSGAGRRRAGRPRRRSPPCPRAAWSGRGWR